MIEEIVVNYFLQSFATPLTTLFFQIVTLFGEPLLWLLFAGVLFWIGKERESFALVTLLIFSSLFAGMAKLLIGRARPDIKNLIRIPGNSSMPSGHSTIAGSIYSYYKRKVKPIEKYLLLGLALLTAVSRIYLGVHFLSDVFVGLLFGYLIGKIYCKLEHKIKERHWKMSKIKDEILYIIIFVFAIVFIMYLPEELYTGYIFLGYYIGFILYRNSNIKFKTKNKKLVVLSGLLIFFGIYSIGLIYTILLIPLFIFDGIFISFIWPLVIKKGNI